MSRSPQSRRFAGPLLRAALCLGLAASSLSASPADGPRHLVDPVNRLAVTLEEPWTGKAPSRDLERAVLVLQRRPSTPPRLQEGHFPDDWLKIELTTVAAAERKPSSGAEAGRPFAFGEIQGRARLQVAERSVDGLQGPPALVLEFPLEDARGLERLHVRARLLPADSLVLDEALPVLASLRVLDPDGFDFDGLDFDGLDFEGFDFDAAGVDIAGELDDVTPDALSRLLRDLVPAAPAAAVDLARERPSKQNLAVTRPIAGSTVISGVTYAVRWTGSHSAAVSITLLQNGQVISCLYPEAPVECVPSPVQGEVWSWPVDGNLSGAGFQVRVQDSAGGAGVSGTFSISNSCGPRANGSEAPASPIDLQMPFAPGTRWTVGGGGSFYGSGFHCNGYNDYYATDWNQAGVDDETGARVLAVADGEVIRVVSPDEEGDCDGAFGCLISIEHRMPADSDNATTLQTTYAHLESTLVAVGDRVWRGQDIGTVGNTGQSTAAHLHLQFREALGNGWSSRCGAVDGPLCPNGEMPSLPQGYRPSPMGTTDGDQELVDSTTYESANGIAVTEPSGEAIRWRIGEKETIAWLAYLPYVVRLDLCHEEYRCRYIAALPPQYIDRFDWTVPSSIVPGSGYFVRVSDYFRPAVKHESPPIKIEPPGCGDIEIQPSSLPAGSVGEAYSASLEASGGNAPYLFEQVGGELPPGLTLAPDGEITGAPSAAGSWTVKIIAIDDGGCEGEAVYTIAIDDDTPPPCGAGEVCVQMPGPSLVWTYDTGQCDGGGGDNQNTDENGYVVLGPFPPYCDNPDGEDDYRLHGHWCDSGAQYCLSDFSDPNWNDEGISYNWNPDDPFVFEFTAADFEACGHCSP